MNELRVFISSTFRDLQEEREHLVKKIFPEIRALCRERGIRFTEVDLRWGLTDEDVELGRVIRTCLEEVDKCRPYFIGITGDRYGFVPTYLDVHKDPDLLERYPWIVDAAADAMSITEMEAQYGVLNASLASNASTPSMRANRARFYFRRHRATLDDSHDDAEEQKRLEAYQQRIRNSGAQTAEFRDPSLLGELIYDDLIEFIKNDFADTTAPSALEEERARHEAFSLSRRRAYIPNPLYLKRLDDHATSDAPPLVVYAESGSGKSSLFAYWADQYRRKNPGSWIIEHYVGIGATATDHYAVIRHICMEINERLGRDEVIPSEPADLELAFGQWLGYADHELTKRGESVVLILDGLNQLQGTALNLRWIPDVIPPSVRMILSSTVEGTLIELKKRGWTRFGMQALSEAERETIVVRYLAEYHKSLNPDQVKRVALDYKCGHPLFLKTVLEELRLVGRHEELDTKIEAYLDATGTEDLFQYVLERLEEDYNMRAVREVMVLLSASRSGLDERELSEVSGLARLKIATMIAGLDYHLVRKEGRLTFFHDYLRRAVEKRYLTDQLKRRSTHTQLADYFQKCISESIETDGTAPGRLARELVYQLDAAGATDRVLECLTTMPIFLSLYDGDTLYEVLGYWAHMDTGIDVAGCYRRGLNSWRMMDAVERSRGVGRVADLVERLNRWSEAVVFSRERLAAAIDAGDTTEEADARYFIGRALLSQGEYAEALRESRRALEIFTELGDRKGASNVIGIIGLIHADLGERDQALECYERKLRMDTESGDLNGASKAIGNMALVYTNRREDDRAMECLERQLRIAEESGDLQGISRAVGAMGRVFQNRFDYDRAVACYERQISTAAELGDRHGVSIGVGNIGTLYFGRGELDKALECIERHVAIDTELGDRVGMSYAIGNMGLLHQLHGDYDQAMECYNEQLRVGEEFGSRNVIVMAIWNMGFLYALRGDYDRALECYSRQIDIAEELADRHIKAYAIGNTGWVHFSRGEFDRAMECHEHQLSVATELEDRHGQFLALGSMGIVFAALQNYERALEHFQRAEQGHRSISRRAELSDWLLENAVALVEIAASQEKTNQPDLMPEFLPRFVPGAKQPASAPPLPPGTPGDWRALSRQRARECAEECLTISEALQKADTLFGARVLLSRIQALDGDIDGAVDRLESMLADMRDERRSPWSDDQRATLHYWLWMIARRDADRTDALLLYSELYPTTPKFVYKKRIDELTKEGEA